MHTPESQSQSEVLGLLCAELCRSAFSSMATSRNLRDQDIIELILELNSDTYSPKDKDISDQWQWHRWHYWHKLHTVNWQHKLFTYYTCSPQDYSGSQWLRQTPHTNKDSSPLSVFILCFLKLYNCWWKRKTGIITSTWTHWMKDSPHCLTWSLRKCLFMAYCADGAGPEGHAERLLFNTTTVLHCLLWKHYDTYISTF